MTFIGVFALVVADNSIFLIANENCAFFIVQTDQSNLAFNNDDWDIIEQSYFMIQGSN